MSDDDHDEDAWREIDDYERANAKWLLFAVLCLVAAFLMTLESNG